MTRLKPKKSLGQNFLFDKNIREKIIRSCDLGAEDIVLEIGSGTGILTSRLAEHVKQIFAVEIDKNLHGFLEENLKNCGNCSLIKGDILKLDINKFLKEQGITRKIKVIGNIPYYISSPIIEYLIKYRGNLDSVFLTVQKEFGRRMAASPGSKDYSSFSCFVQYYALTKILFEIKRGSFRPEPKVDSVFLKLKLRETPAVKVEDEELFFKLIRSAFGQRRKTLRNSLESLTGKETLENFFKESGLNRNARPETLSLDNFALMSKILKK